MCEIYQLQTLEDDNNNAPEAGAGNGNFDFMSGGDDTAAPAQDDFFGVSDAPAAAATAATDADDFFAVDDTPAAPTTATTDAEDDFFAVDDAPAGPVSGVNVEADAEIELESAGFDINDNDTAAQTAVAAPVEGLGT